MRPSNGSSKTAFPEDRSILVAVLDAAALGTDPRTEGELLFRNGVDWIQLRDRSLSDRSLFEVAQALVTARNTIREDSDSLSRSPRILLNKRNDVALASDADGVHLGFDAQSPETSATLWGPHRLLGASCHTLSEIEAATGGPLDYVHLAPIWDPRSKPATRKALGLTTLRDACRIGPPVLAQGGLDEKRAGQAIMAGARGIAVTGILNLSAQTNKERRESIGAIRQSMDEANATRLRDGTSLTAEGTLP